MNPGLYTVLFENDRVRLLEYRDQSGARTAGPNLSAIEQFLRGHDRA